MAADVSATGVSLVGNLKHHPASRAVMMQFRFIASFTLFPRKMPQLGLRLILGTAQNKIAARPKATRSWELGQGCPNLGFLCGCSCRSSPGEGFGHCRILALHAKATDWWELWFVMIYDRFLLWFEGWRQSKCCWRNREELRQKNQDFLGQNWMGVQMLSLKFKFEMLAMVKP